MKIKIAKPDFAYSFLLRMTSLRQEGKEREPWKTRDDDEELEKIRASGCIKYCFVELPEPLDRAFPIFHRSGDLYCMEMNFVARDPSVYVNLSSALNNALRQVGKEFFPTTASGTGHVIDSKRRVVASISAFSNQDNIRIGREIVIGADGAYDRVLPQDFSEFALAVSELEALTNIFASCCYQPLIDAGRIKPFPPELVLSINPAK